MQCEACGVDNGEGRRFCRECGAALSLRCTACGFANESGDRFCGGCGVALRGAGPGAAAPAGAAETEVETGAEDDAQRRQLTVMFCDLADSTALSERLDPEDLSRVNRLYQQTCSAVIEDFDGYVARYMGDGILCYFGYPRAHEDDVERAIRAALRLQQRIGELNETGGGPVELAVRVGIATGPTIIGEMIGEGASRESTAVGRTPNLAARLQSEAPRGGVVISDDTRKLAGNLFSYRPLGELRLKGLDQPVPAWQVESESVGATRFEAISSGALTPFVGRRHELLLIGECWEQARSGRGGVILLCGEAGIGKSRLIQQANELDPDHTRILQCSPHHQHSALHPVIEFLRARQGEYSRPNTYWLAEMLDRHGIRDADAEAVLARLVFGESGAGTAAVNAQWQKRRSLEIAEQLLTGSPDRAATILVVEDLHWIDPTTAELVNNMVFSVANRPVLLLLSFRPEYAPPWADHAHVHLLRLNRINPDQCRDMIQSLVGKRFSEALALKIIERTDGIPLFVEELTRALESSTRDDGIGDIHIPETLADSLNARLDSLGDARRTAQAAAVIGRSFERALLREITGLNDVDLEAQLSLLVGSGLVYRVGSGDAERYQFKHALIQDAAYTSLLRDRRRGFHRRAAEHLESLFQTGHKLVDLLAYHYVRAGVVDKGMHYARLAGDEALATSAVVEALEHYQTGLSLAPVVGESAGTRSAELYLQLGIAACHRYRDEYEQALERLGRAETLAAELDDAAALSDLHNLRGNIYFPTGNLDGCLREHQRSLECARACRSLEKEARAVGGLGDAYYLRGEMAAAKDKFLECCALSERHGFVVQDAANRPMIGWSRIYQLEFGEAEEDGLKAIELCRECGHLRGQMNARGLLATVYAEMDRREDAQRHAGEAAVLARKLGTYNFEAAIRYFSSLSAGPEVDRARLRDDLIEALNTSRELGHGFHGPGILGGLLLFTDDPGQRSACSREAEEWLSRPCVGHNYYWYYRDAMQAAIDFREWDNLERLRRKFEAFDAPHRTPWCEFFVARSRVLEDFHRQRAGDATLRMAQALLDQARQAHMLKSARELEAALGAASAPQRRQP